MTAPLPNPFTSGFLSSSPLSFIPSTSDAEETVAAVAGDAPAAATTPGLPPEIFKPDFNRLYLDIVFGSNDAHDARPLFLRKPFKPRNDIIVERKVARSFIEALIDLGKRD